jgi:ATPase subunit of ABC transporter with duplicated ATPase domains
VIDEVATRIWHIDKGRIDDFSGSYAQYLSQSEHVDAARSMLV